ncbi:MAG: GNAT family N-acetyltransferase, partial [Armatimonadota bacterium]
MPGRKQLTVAQHEWSAFVERSVFEQVLVSAAGVPIAYLLLTRSEYPHEWLLLNPILSVLCFFCAFLRVWRTSKEEAETKEAWEALSDHLTPAGKCVDMILEVPYVFVLFILPFSAVAYQVFVVALGGFYAVDCVYNLMCTAAVRKHHLAVESSRDQCAACPLRGYYARRQWLDNAGLALTVVPGGTAWYLVLQGRTEAALWVGIASVIALILMEGMLEPIVNWPFHWHAEQSMGDRVRIVDIRPSEPVSSETCDKLNRIHIEAFPPEEQQMSMEFMLSKTGSDGYGLKAVFLGDAVVGYAFYQVHESAEIAFLWYMAVDAEWRRIGVGREIVTRLISDLGTRRAVVRYLLLEARAPEPDAPADDINRRRIAFYRSLGAHWVRGIDYAVASHTDPDRSISYEVLAFPVADHVTPERLRPAVSVLASESMGANDPHLERFR